MDRDNGDSLSWHYLDSVQKEFGPFGQATMRDWFNQGFFPNGEELMIRLPHWKHHVALKMVWPDVAQAFTGVPQLSPQTIAQVGLQEQQYAELPGNFARREEPASYVADMSGFWNRPDVALRNGTGYPGMPGLPGDLPMMPQVAQELLERMPMAGVPNLAPVMTDLAGISMMQGLSAAHMPMPDSREVRTTSLDGFGFPQMMMPMQPAFQATNTAQLMQMGSRPNRFRGRIKSFNAKQGFGFIENPEAYAMFGRDVFLHKAQIGNLKVGMEVTYGVEMNKFGMPQARDLATLDGKPPGPPPASVAKGGTKTKAAAKRVKGNEDVPAIQP